MASATTIPNTLLALFQTRTRATGLVSNIAIVLFGTLFLAICAKIQVPVWPVPVTLQGFAVAVIAAAFGLRIGVATVALYLAEGAAGLPVFATGGGNVSSLDFEATVLVGTTSDCRYESHIRATRSTGQMGMIATNGIRVPVTVTLHSHAVHADCSVYTTYRLSIAHPNLGSDDYVNTWEEPVAVPLRQREKDCNP